MPLALPTTADCSTRLHVHSRSLRLKHICSMHAFRRLFTWQFQVFLGATCHVLMQEFAQQLHVDMEAAWRRHTEQVKAWLSVQASASDTPATLQQGDFDTFWAQANELADRSRSEGGTHRMSDVVDGWPKPGAALAQLSACTLWYAHMWLCRPRWLHLDCLADTSCAFRKSTSSSLI